MCSFMCSFIYLYVWGVPQHVIAYELAKPRLGLAPPSSYVGVRVAFVKTHVSQGR